MNYAFVAVIFAKYIKTVISQYSQDLIVLHRSVHKDMSEIFAQTIEGAAMYVLVIPDHGYGNPGNPGNQHTRLSSVHFYKDPKSR